MAVKLHQRGMRNVIPESAFYRHDDVKRDVT